jgi:hypothetical protein
MIAAVDHQDSRAVAGPEGPLPSVPSAGRLHVLRASDSDRAHAVRVLTESCGDGRLTLEELDCRISSALSAAGIDDLDELTTDLPPRRAPKQRIVTVIGNSARSYTRPAARTAVVTVFGETVVDLRAAFVDTAELELRMYLLGGRQLVMVPEGVDIQVSGLVLMGSHRLELSHNRPRGRRPRLVVRVVGMMGAVTLQGDLAASGTWNTHECHPAVLQSERRALPNGWSAVTEERQPTAPGELPENPDPPSSVFRYQAPGGHAAAPLCSTSACRCADQGGLDAAAYERAVPAPPNNPRAVASFVCSLLGVIPIIGLATVTLAVVLGFVGLSEIKASRGAQVGRGMALTGLIISAVITSGWMLFLGFGHNG